MDLLLRDTGLEAQYLELEMTETMIMENAGSIITTLQELKSLGVQISIDDFGTGYSSLSYLTKFAIDKLKIDKSFVEGITKDTGSATITRTIVSMAQNLNLKTIAEGVETREQLEFLTAAGCNEAQGFLLGKPVSSEEFPELFSNPASRQAAG